MTIATYIFLAILGLVAGGAIVWVLLAAHPFETPEEPPALPDPAEPAFLAAEMTRRGKPIDEATATELLNLHLDYLEGRVRANIAAADRELLEKERAEYRRRHELDELERAPAQEAADSDGRADAAHSANPADPADAGHSANPAPSETKAAREGR